MSACGTCGQVHARLSDEWFCGYAPQDPAEVRALGLLTAAEERLARTEAAIARRELPELTTTRGTAA